jgi:hypothetical protein
VRIEPSCPVVATERCRHSRLSPEFAILTSLCAAPYASHCVVSISAHLVLAHLVRSSSDRKCILYSFRHSIVNDLALRYSTLLTLPGTGLEVTFPRIEVALKRTTSGRLETNLNSRRGRHTQQYHSKRRSCQMIYL